MRTLVLVYTSRGTFPHLAPPSSRGCVYLNVCLNGECYCSNRGWHHSTILLYLSPPAFSLLLWLRPSTPSSHAHAHTHVHRMTLLCQREKKKKFMNHWCTNQPQACCKKSKLGRSEKGKKRTEINRESVSFKSF